MELCLNCGAYWACEHRSIQPPIVAEATFEAFDELERLPLGRSPIQDAIVGQRTSLIIQRILDSLEEH